MSETPATQDHECGHDPSVYGWYRTIGDSDTIDASRPFCALCELARLATENERMRRQAVAISEMLSEAGVGSGTIVEGIRRVLYDGSGDEGKGTLRERSTRKRHRCMRCLEEYDCPSPGTCEAQCDTLPMPSLGHDCPKQPDWDWIRAYGKRMRTLGDAGKRSS